MIITKVILTDYGVYGGRNEFDLTPVQDKPIILFGGTNGAGKTTLFEAVPLCLYGISAADRRITRAAYNKFLAKKVHRYQKSAVMADSASIVVQFKFYHNSKETEYRVERSWQTAGGRITDEQLNVKKRTSPRASFKDLDTMEASHWQSFVSDIIPKGILRLFFFDGERVVEIAKEGAEDATIRDAFKSLLGIEIVEQLHTDLQVNLTRNLMGDDKPLQDEIAECEVEREETTRSIERLREQLDKKHAEMDLLSAEIESAESSISKIGGAFASDRDAARVRLGEARAKHEVARRQITEMCSDALYTTLIPRQIDTLLKQMNRDDTIFQNKAAAKTLDGKIKELSTILCAGLDDNQKRTIQSSITKFAKDEMYNATVEKPVFGFSESQATFIRSVIHHANTVLYKSLREQIKVLVECDKEITTLESAIASAPAEDELGPLVSRVSELYLRQGSLQEEMNHTEEKISSNGAMLSHIETKLRGLLNKAYKDKKAKEQIRLTHQVQKVLEEFIGRLRDRKVRLLEQYLLDATHTLLHKQNLIHRIQIDSQTFKITIYGPDDTPIPKEMLSEGEKQVFAMSVLWALAKTSGRPLPFMIDTPLARLDGEHRSSIVERFLPIASHQTMVFSTNTEIEESEYEKLSIYMTKSYMLAFDEDTGSTSPYSGYFWGAEIVPV